MVALATSLIIFLTSCASGRDERSHAAPAREPHLSAECSLSADGHYREAELLYMQKFLRNMRDHVEEECEKALDHDPNHAPSRDLLLEVRFISRAPSGPEQNASLQGPTAAIKTIANPQTSYGQLLRALKELKESQHQPAKFFWSEIARDDRFSEGHRRECKREFLERHVSGGISLREWLSLPGVHGWFDWYTVRSVDQVRNPLPGYRQGRLMTDIRLSFFFKRSDDLTVYLRLSRTLTEDQLRDLLEGRATDPDVRVLEVRWDN